MDSPVLDLAGDGRNVMQKNAFTRWANENLRQANKVISDLYLDLHDGVCLIALVEALSGKKLPKYNRRPSHRSQKLENISIVLDFLMSEEGIHFENIDSLDIMNGNSKLILGLMWTLILHYAISEPMWDGLKNANINHNQTPKQKLLGWITSKIPDKPIRNFTTDWNDGTAIGALVDAVASGLCPDWPTWNPKNNVANATKAMSAAEQWLGVPQLIKPNEMCNPKVDEMSMMTYLSQFPSATVKQGTPLHPRTNPSNVRAIAPATEAHKCFVTGRGIQPKGVRVDDQCDFTVHTTCAEGEAEVVAMVVESDGVEKKLILKRHDPKMYQYSYVPTRIGWYVVSITYGGQRLFQSPFRVEVGPKKDSKIRVFGSGLQHGIVGYPACFILDTNGDSHALRLSVEGPSRAIIDFKDNGDGSTDFSYLPTAAGEYAVHVLCGGEDIPRSPFMVYVSTSTTKFDPTKVEVHGPGILKTGITVSKWAEFVVDARLAGYAPLHIVVTEVDYHPVDVVVTDNKDETYNCRYMPRHDVEHFVIISYGSVAVPNSPFRVTECNIIESVVLVSNPSRVKVFGPALDQQVRVHQSTHLLVDGSEAGPEACLESVNDIAIDPRAIDSQAHGKTKAILPDPAGSPTEVPITSNKDGTPAEIYTPLQKDSLSNDEIKQRIVNIYAKFVADVDPDRLCDWLVQESVITPERSEEIRSENRTSRKRCRNLLDFLFSTHHPRAFLVVRQALSDENHYLLEFIDK